MAIGLLVALVGSELVGRDAASTDAVSRTAPLEVDGPQDLLPDDLPVPPGAGAASADDAITGFLRAEATGDYQTSFGYLSDADRARFGSAAGWVAAHADVLAPIVDYDITDRIDPAEDRATITVEVGLVPGIDPVVGLVPGRATATWDVLRGDTGWGVSLASSVLVPDYPPGDGALPAARSWAQARQRCETPDNEHPGLVGSPSLARQLCDAGAPVDVSGPIPLDVTVSQPFATAYGPEAVRAARVVRITGPVELAAVLVPLGDDWTVIGVVP